LSAASLPARQRQTQGAVGRWILILVVLLAFGTRAYRLGGQSLWADEAKSVVVASWPLPAIIAEQIAHEHPPLHYLLLHFLMPLAGRSEFAVRYLSLFFGVLLVPLLYAVGRLLAGERVGILAALLAALSPFYVRFAQETRMYTLAFFLSLLSTYFFLRICLAGERARPAERGWSLGWVLATAAALYSHYFTLFIVIAQMVYVLVSWLCRRASLKPWLWRTLGLGLLLLPWIVLTVQGILSVDPVLRTSAEAAGPNSPVSGGILATLLEGRAGMVSLPAIVRQAFISFGPSDFAGLGATPWLALGFVLVSVVGLWKAPRPAWRWKLWLVLVFCLPLILGFVIGFPANRPFWIKYFGVASPAFYLLVALGLAALLSGRYRWIAGAVLIAGTIGLSVLSLRNYYREPGYGRYDIRPPIEYLEAAALPEDALLVNPWTHFPTFWYYYRAGRPAAETDPTVYYPLDWIDAGQELEAISHLHTGVWVIKNMPNDLDADGVIGSWLARHAFPTITIWADNVRIRYYSLPGPEVADQVGQESYGESIPVFGSQIALEGYRIAPQTRHHRRDLQLTLLWRALTAPETSYSVYAQLVDEQGRIWGQSDSPPRAGFYPTREWMPGERVEDHLGLSALPGTPPGTYWVRLGLHRADDGTRLPVTWSGGTPDSGTGPAPEPDSLWLGPVELEQAANPPPFAWLDLTRRLEPTPVLGHLELLGYSLEAGTFEPGAVIPLTLFWRAGEESHQDHHLVLRLEDEQGQVRAESRDGVTADAYPLSRWAVGEVVRDPRHLQIAGDAPPGRYRLLAALVDPASNAEVDSTTVDYLAVQERARQFSVPPLAHPLQADLGGNVRLLGYDLANGRGFGEGGRIDVEPGDSLELTLYWQTLAPMDVSYTVFTHLLDLNSMIWGQHDSVPGGGTLPTTSWVADQVIEDHYVIAVKPDAPAGEYSIEVGMYDAVTGQRLEVLSTAGEAMGDRVLIPAQVLVK
jgi:4-amino-4-deoxy-L-arabinose transferase-like glycosyltransferase